MVPVVEGVVGCGEGGPSCNLSICRSESPNSNHSENGDRGGGGGRYSDMPERALAAVSSVDGAFDSLRAAASSIV